jgi:hypothetical protein
MQTNRLGEDNDERMGELRVSYVGEPTVGDGGGMSYESYRHMCCLPLPPERTFSNSY